MDKGYYGDLKWDVLFSFLDFGYKKFEREYFFNVI